MTLSTKRITQLREDTRKDRQRYAYETLTQLAEESLRPSYRRVFRALPKHTSYIKSRDLAERLNMSQHMVSTALCYLARLGMVRRASVRPGDKDPGHWWRRDDYTDAVL